MFTCASLVMWVRRVLHNFQKTKRATTWKRVLLKTVLIPFFVLLTPIVLVTFVVFGLYREVVRMILKLKYGASFLGFFERQDGLNINSYHAQCVINVILIIECLENQHNSRSIFEILSNSVKEIVFKNRTPLRKLVSTHHHFMGYTYMKENSDINVLDCVKYLQTGNSNKKTDLVRLVSDLSSETLPCDNKLMWDVNVGIEPLKWKENSKNAHYPIIFRFHHSVADAVEIFEFISGVFGYNPNSKPSKTIIPQTPSILKKCLQEILNWTNIFLFFPSTFYNLLVTKKVFSLTHKPKFQKGVVAIHVEEFKKYVSIIQNIKRKCSTTFTSVLSAAFSVALKEYYAKNEMIPEHEVAVIPFNPKGSSLIDFIPGSINVNDVDLHNKCDIIHLNLPLSPKKFEDNENPLKKLNLITENLKQEKNSKTGKALNLYMNLYNTLAPLPMTRFFGNLVTFGPSLSSVPMSEKFKFVDKFLSVCDYIFCVPDQVLTPFSLSIASYDKRLQLVLNAAREGCNVDDAEWILNQFLRAIDKLDEACCNF